MTYAPETLIRQQADTLPGLTVLEFGANWCGHCQAAQGAITEALAGRAALRHIKIEDGPGRPLGRSYRVKLWPTLVLLRDGVEAERLVRPTRAVDVAAALARLTGE